MLEGAKLLEALLLFERGWRTVRRSRQYGVPRERIEAQVMEGLT